jgi:hypothetical protein
MTPQRFFISKMILYAAVIAIIVVIAPGCTTIETRYVTTQLSRPERPVLPKIKGSELQCVPQETYQKLYDRQRLITEYAIKLETIVDSTKEIPDEAK